MMLVPACRRLDRGDTVGTAAAAKVKDAAVDCVEDGGDAKFKCGTAWRNPCTFSLPEFADTIGENDEEDDEADSGA